MAYQLQTKMTMHFEHTSFLLFHAPIYTSRDYRQVEAEIRAHTKTDTLFTFYFQRFLTTYLLT